MKLLRSIAPLASMCVMLAATTLSHASTITGTVWYDQSGNVPTDSSRPNNGHIAATFNATSLDFCVASSDACPGSTALYTIDGFLNSNGGASGVSNVVYQHGQDGSKTLDNTLFEFTGSAFFTNGQTYNLGHDDGAVLYVGGVQVYSDPGPTSYVNTPYIYTGTTGTHSFDFLYGETSGAPAVFETNLEGPLTSTPEPSSFILLGSGLLAAAGLVRRRLSV